MKGNFMLTKIKTVLKKVTVVEWVVLGIAVLALWLAFAQKHGSAHKGPHKADKVAETVTETK